MTPGDPPAVPLPAFPPRHETEQKGILTKNHPLGAPAWAWCPQSVLKELDKEPHILLWLAGRHQCFPVLGPLG